MIATVFIDSPNDIANHLIDDRPSATVEGDFLTALERGRNSVERVRLSTDEGRCVFLSHESSIAESVGNTSFNFVFLTFIFSLFLYFVLDT